MAVAGTFVAAEVVDVPTVLRMSGERAVGEQVVELFGRRWFVGIHAGSCQCEAPDVMPVPE